MKSYCCGKKAEEDRFAKKWARINTPIDKHKSEFTPSPRAKKVAEGYIKLGKRLPQLILPGSNSLILVWHSEKGPASLFIDKENEESDTFSIDGVIYGVDRVEELLCGII